jgi:hypothetical protein
MAIAHKEAASGNGSGGPLGGASAPLVDHRRINGLFAEYRSTQSVARKTQLISQLCAELSMSGHGEEDIFFPKVKMILKDNEWILEATAENAGLKALIAQLEAADPNGKTFDGKIDVLSEIVKRRLKEEQSVPNPTANLIRLAMQKLGSSNALRKKTLLASLAMHAPRLVK